MAGSVLSVFVIAKSMLPLIVVSAVAELLVAFESFSVLVTEAVLVIEPRVAASTSTTIVTVAEADGE